MCASPVCCAPAVPAFRRLHASAHHSVLLLLATSYITHHRLALPCVEARCWLSTNMVLTSSSFLSGKIRTFHSLQQQGSRRHARTARRTVAVNAMLEQLLKPVLSIGEVGPPASLASRLPTNCSLMSVIKEKVRRAAVDAVTKRPAPPTRGARPAQTATSTTACTLNPAPALPLDL